MDHIWWVLVAFHLAEQRIESPLVCQRLSYYLSDLRRLEVCQIIRIFAVYRACAIDENAIWATSSCQRRFLPIIFGSLQDIITCFSESIHIIIGRQVIPVRHDHQLGIMSGSGHGLDIGRIIRDHWERRFPVGRWTSSLIRTIKLTVCCILTEYECHRRGHPLFYPCRGHGTSMYRKSRLSTHTDICRRVWWPIGRDLILRPPMGCWFAWRSLVLWALGSAFFLGLTQCRGNESTCWTASCWSHRSFPISKRWGLGAGSDSLWLHHLHPELVEGPESDHSQRSSLFHVRLVSPSAMWG